MDCFQGPRLQVGQQVECIFKVQDCSLVSQLNTFSRFKTVSLVCQLNAFSRFKTVSLVSQLNTQIRRLHILIADGILNPLTT